MWFISLLVFILILGIIILVHEFGHYIMAKKSGVYIYEFSIGMGPVVYSHKGKDGIDYNLRAFPIGGFVQMAGEIYEDDGEIPKEKFLCNRPALQRFCVLVAGVFNNFVLALLCLFIISFIWGPQNEKAIISGVQEGSAAEKSGIRSGDELIGVNNHDFSSWDVGQLYLYFKYDSNEYEFKLRREDGNIETIKITPNIETLDGGEERKVFGIQIDTKQEKNFINCLKYPFIKFKNMLLSMIITLKGLFTGGLSIKNLSGPVGIYQVVNQSLSLGISQLIYTLALLSLNVGFINILPFPAFDGGHVLFMIIEKIKGSKINSKIENAFTMVGFILLMLLMILITFQDIINLF